MMRQARALLTAILSVSLLASSAAAAATSVPTPPATQSSGWTTLSLLTANGVALGAAGAAAGQAEVPPPPPPPPPAGFGHSPDTTWMLIGASVILLGLLALAVSEGSDHDDDNQATSPF